jgi:hypothetical protein
MISLEANWNRPLMVIAMICFTVIACYVITNVHKWLK